MTPSPRDGFVKIDFAQDSAWRLERRKAAQICYFVLDFGCIFVYCSKGRKTESGIGQSNFS